ncbi:MAG: hypothetical protein ABJF23_20465 [Bryobacteraceae bacterium]
MRRLFIGLALISTAFAQQQELLTVRRVFVEQLNGGDSAYQIRDLLISAIQNAKLFVLTENKERADAVMRGSAGDTVFDDTFQSSEGISARAGVGSASVSTSSKSNSRLPGVSVGQNESTRISERKHEAIATVRLINKDGDVIWSTTQESPGAKFHGASADVAERVTRQLAADIEKARKSAALK